MSAPSQSPALALNVIVTGHSPGWAFSGALKPANTLSPSFEISASSLFILAVSGCFTKRDLQKLSHVRTRCVYAGVVLPLFVLPTSNVARQ